MFDFKSFPIKLSENALIDVVLEFEKEDELNEFPISTSLLLVII